MARLLVVRDLAAGYGKIGVLHGLSLRVYAGEIVTLLGPNGAGKTTLLKALSGLLPWTGGDASLAGRRCGTRRRGTVRGAGWCMSSRGIGCSRN